jgi:hypothetical protein
VVRYDGVEFTARRVQRGRVFEGLPAMRRGT